VNSKIHQCPPVAKAAEAVVVSGLKIALTFEIARGFGKKLSNLEK
jgi:hypothetical protein